MRVRHAIALAALTLLLSACGADTIIMPETLSAESTVRLEGGWMGGPGAVEKPADPEAAN